MKAWLMAVLMAVPLGAMAESRWIEVTGQAQGQLPVDKVHLTSRIELVAKNPLSAKEQVDAQVTKLLELFNAHGVPEQSVDAGSLRVVPEYHYQDRAKELVGYRATRTIGLNLQAEESGKWLALLLENGVNHVEEPWYWSSSADEFEQELMDFAFNNAMAKAKRLAKASGNSVGEVLMIQESRGGAPRPKLAMSRMESGDAYQPGGQTIMASVQVRVELND